VLSNTSFFFEPPPQRGSRRKDLQPFGLSHGGALAALLLSHRAPRLCFFVASCQRSAMTQRTPFLFMRWVLARRYAKLVIKSFSQRQAPMLPPGQTQTLSAGHLVMPHNKALDDCACVLRFENPVEG
jgi:hypothetical protein